VKDWGGWPLSRAAWCSGSEVLQLPRDRIDPHNPCNPLVPLPRGKLLHLREITAWRSGSDNAARKITSADRFSISATSTGDICPSPTHFILCRDSGIFLSCGHLTVCTFHRTLPHFLSHYSYWFCVILKNKQLLFHSCKFECAFAYRTQISNS
jgi:hypothetical protein